ncbi:hypothetical protein PLICRDRAFT_122057 [Plicaturopsis crispa FD-325 SS-3]|nr:hypothetical protein PLICRDRAFT_122057 [Plicaturopsis crispa FD-325 SS-3]
MDASSSNDEGSGLFFAGSDEEDDTRMVDETGAGEQRYRSAEQHLFFPDSDEEDEHAPVFFPSPSKRQVSPYVVDDDSDVEIPFVEDVPRPSSVSSSSVRASSVESIRSVSPPTKKRRISPTPAPLPPQPAFHSAYIGSFIVPNAYSTAKGKGYIKPGDPIKLERDELEDPTTKASSSKAKGKAKQVNKGGKKQLSIATMLQHRPTKISNIKKSRDTIIRLSNARGFEFGRIPQDVAAWVSKLLDLGIIDFRGSTMIDCPDVLHSGADLIISLSVYIRASAFQTPSTSASKDSKKRDMFSEGQETLDEQVLRERKTSLLRLFDVIGLKPRHDNKLGERSDKSESEIHANALKETNQQPLDRRKPVKTEVVGDGEEIEVEEGEELDENELNLIYKRAQENDRAMGEMEPANTFALTLRGYQKQALLWMHSLELGQAAAREAHSMHPLWSEYIFPGEPVDGIIDLTADEKPFYFNPLS